MSIHAGKPKGAARRKAKQSRGRKRYTLPTLVASMTKASSHEEVSTGQPRGREAW